MRWTLIDFAEVQATAKVAAAGTATASFTAVDANYLWQVTRAVVASDSSGDPTCVLHCVDTDEAPTLRSQRSGTRSGIFDEADYAADGLAVMPNKQLIAVWAGATPGATAVVTITYRRYTRT